MVKLGTVALARQREYAGGTTVQQLGIKPSQAEVQRVKTATAERERIRKENVRITAANKAAQEKYLAEKAGIDAANARRAWLYSKINARLKGQDYASSAPKGLSQAEQKTWDNAMSSGASASVYAAKYGLYPTGEIKYKVGEELVSSYKVIPQTKLQPEPQLVQIKKPGTSIIFGPEAYKDVQQKIKAGDVKLQEQVAGRDIKTISYEFVTVPPEQKTFKETAKERGWITTIHRKLVEVSPAIFKAQEKSPFGIKTADILLPTKAKEFKAKAVTAVGPYAIPYFGESLLIGKAVESYAYPGGRKELVKAKEWLSTAGFPSTKDWIKTQVTSPFKQSLLFVKPTLPPAKTVYALPAAEIILGAWGLKTRLTKPIIKIRPAKEPVIRFKETVKPSKGGKASLAKFKIVQYEPARKAEVTTHLKKLFGKKPKIIEISKPTIRTIETLHPIKLSAKGEIIGKGDLIFGRTGAKGKSVNQFLAELGGGETPLKLSSYKSLTKTQQFGLKKLAEMKVGRAVPQKYVPQVLGKTLTEDLYGKGYLELEKTWRVKGNIFKKEGLEFEAIPYGKRITRAEIITRTQEVKEVPFKTSFGTVTKTLPKEAQGEWFLGEVAVKSVTKPFPRAVGKIPYLKGYTYIKDPIKGGDFVKTILTTKTITKPVVSKTLLKLGEVKGAAVTGLPITKSTIKFPTEVTKAIVGAKLVSKTIPVVAATTIPMYKTETLTLPTTKPLIKISTKPSIKSVTKPIVKPITKPAVKTITKPVLKPITKPILKPIIKPIIKPIVKPIVTITTIPGLPPPTKRGFIWIPSLGLGKKRKAPKRQFKTPSFKVSRQPSLLALGEKIRARKPGRAEFTGLTLRPILIPEEKKKKRKLWGISKFKLPKKRK